MMDEKMMALIFDFSHGRLTSASDATLSVIDDA